MNFFGAFVGGADAQKRRELQSIADVEAATTVEELLEALQKVKLDSVHSVQFLVQILSKAKTLAQQKHADAEKCLLRVADVTQAALFRADAFGDMQRRVGAELCIAHLDRLLTHVEEPRAESESSEPQETVALRKQFMRDDVAFVTLFEALFLCFRQRDRCAHRLMQVLLALAFSCQEEEWQLGRHNFLCRADSMQRLVTLITPGDEETVLQEAIRTDAVVFLRVLCHPRYSDEIAQQLRKLALYENAHFALLQCCRRDGLVQGGARVQRHLCALHALSVGNRSLFLHSSLMAQVPLMLRYSNVGAKETRASEVPVIASCVAFLSALTEGQVATDVAEAFGHVASQSDYSGNVMLALLQVCADDSALKRTPLLLRLHAWRLLRLCMPEASHRNVLTLCDALLVVSATGDTRVAVLFLLHTALYLNDHSGTVSGSTVSGSTVTFSDTWDEIASHACFLLLRVCRHTRVGALLCRTLSWDVHDPAQEHPLREHPFHSFGFLLMDALRHGSDKAKHNALLLLFALLSTHTFVDVANTPDEHSVVRQLQAVLRDSEDIRLRVLSLQCLHHLSDHLATEHVTEHVPTERVATGALTVRTLLSLVEEPSSELRQVAALYLLVRIDRINNNKSQNGDGADRDGVTALNGINWIRLIDHFNGDLGADDGAAQEETQRLWQQLRPRAARVALEFVLSHMAAHVATGPITPVTTKVTTQVATPVSHVATQATTEETEEELRRHVAQLTRQQNELLFLLASSGTVTDTVTDTVNDTVTDTVTDTDDHADLARATRSVSTQTEQATPLPPPVMSEQAVQTEPSLPRGPLQPSQSPSVTVPSPSQQPSPQQQQPSPQKPLQQPSPRALLQKTLPQSTLPVLTAPSVITPSVTAPSVTAPSVTTPSVTVDTPPVTTPSPHVSQAPSPRSVSVQLPPVFTPVLPPQMPPLRTRTQSIPSALDDYGGLAAVTDTNECADTRSHSSAPVLVSAVPVSAVPVSTVPVATDEAGGDTGEFKSRLTSWLDTSKRWVASQQTKLLDDEPAKAKAKALAKAALGFLSGQEETQREEETHREEADTQTLAQTGDSKAETVPTLPALATSVGLASLPTRPATVTTSVGARPIMPSRWTGPVVHARTVPQVACLSLYP
ncbi:MAG: hypothetical protein MHM6MM_001105 [Cercozoa sp. M6MM]